VQKVIPQLLGASELQLRFRTLHGWHDGVQYGLLHFIIVPGSPLYNLLPDEALLDLVPLPLLNDSLLLDLDLLDISQLVINELLHAPPPRVVEVRVHEVVLGLAHMLLLGGYLVEVRVIECRVDVQFPSLRRGDKLRVEAAHGGV
jgi:hypothetical protein